MKRMCVLGLLLCGVVRLFAQQYSVEYTYDFAGNRIGRTVITLSNQSRARATEVEPLVQEANKCKVVIYPNPTKGKIALEVREGKEECSYSAIVYSSGGQKLLKEFLVGNGTISIDLSGYSAGVYILVLRYESNELQYKIIKQ